MLTRVRAMQGHHIICGQGRMGLTICKHLAERSQPFVVIDYNSEKLESCKSNVGLYIATHGARKWRAAAHAHTNLSWPGARRAPASRGYFKMFEIARTCVLPSPNHALRLCEAPGGFVQAVSDLFPAAKCMATSLAGGIAFSDSLPREWLLPVDHNGDILNNDARRHILDLVGPQSCDLVTSDGGFDVDHTKLEAESLVLAQAATAVATQCLAVGGTFVLKFFECNLPGTLRLLAHICAMFESVSIIKPNSSRPSNSERYIVARGFRAEEPLPSSTSARWLSGTMEVLGGLNADQADALETIMKRCH